ncbi:MAG: LLM class flavin-dependent oxidoreductase [Bdellovibrionaceae bacterium]|nr:LLM class flavin-dependent oxidoreductase [Bdellovibrio sp.]
MRFPLSVLDLVPYHQEKSIAQAFNESTRLAQHAEKWGYKRFWIAEHHSIEGVASAATSIVIAHIAAKTSTIRVGSGGIMLPNHAPLIVAEQFGTLETLYPGRIDLGLGRAPGSDRAATRAIRGNRDPHQDDFAEMIEELMNYFKEIIPGQKLKAIPGAGLHLPIYILGSSLYSAHLAARLGQPYVFAGHFAPGMMLSALKIYRDEFQPSKDYTKPYVMIGCPVVAADDDKTANFLATTTYQSFLNLVRGTPRLAIAPVESMQGRWSTEEEYAVKNMLQIFVVGGPARAQEGLRHLIQLTGASEIIVSSNFYRIEDRLRSYEILSGLDLLL